MDEASIAATKLLSALADSRSILLALRGRLRALPEVVEVSSRYEPQILGFGHHVRFSSEVDVELINGKSVTWWYALYWDEKQWMMEAEVSSNDDIGYQTIHEFDPRTAETLEDCIQIIEETTKNLISKENAWRQVLA